MRLEDTYNIHKILNSIFPFFKSKFLCEKGIHNYRIFIKQKHIEPKIYEEYDGCKKIVYCQDNKAMLKCFCCGEEVDLDE